jgi:hypothetical protein
MLRFGSPVFEIANAIRSAREGIIAESSCIYVRVQLGRGGSHIIPDELETWMTDQMLNVAPCAPEKVVEAENDGSVGA